MALQTAEYLSEVEDLGSESGGVRSTLVQGIVLVGLMLIVLLFIFILAKQSGLLTPPNVNGMLLGSSSTIENYPLKLRSPVELDGKSAEKILEMRKAAIRRHAELISTNYEPSATFAALPKQGGKWLGTLGKFGHPIGSDGADGPTDASRQLLNPLLLINADIWPLDASLNRVKMAPSRFSETTMRDYHQGNRSLPFFCEPVGLVWQPQQRRAIVTYDVGKFLAERKNTDKSQVTLATMAEVDFQWFNARDLNFNHCYTSPRFAKNVTMTSGLGEPFALQDEINSQGQWLNANTSFQEGSFRLMGAYPASVEFLLWKKKPREGTHPDLRFTVRFENCLAVSPEARKWIEYFRGSQDALCLAGVALAEVANDQTNLEARDVAIMASQRLESLAHLQSTLPNLVSQKDKAVNRYITGKELQVGYSVFSRSAGVIQRLNGVPGYEQLVKEFNKPHWQTLRNVR